MKIAFFVGIVTDALALVPMLCAPVAKFFWGLGDFTGSYFFAMGYGASLMLAWTLLLCWAYRKPLERKGVALLTILILICFVATEIASAANGILPFAKLLPSLILQAMWLVLYGFGYFYGCAALREANRKSLSAGA